MMLSDSMRAPPHFVALGFLLFGSAILVYLCSVLAVFPLFDWAFTDLHWCQAWLWMTVVDYYGVACCLAAVAIYSESLVLGILWSLGFMLLGSPVCCAYVCYRLVIHGGLSLSEKRDLKEGNIPFRHLGE